MSETELNIKRRMSELECAAGGISSQRMFTQMRNLVNQALESRANQSRPAVQGEPTDDELLEWAGEEQFFLFCDEDEFLQIARSVIHKYGRRGAAVQRDVSALVGALERVMYCNEVGFLPESVQQAVSDALAAQQSERGKTND